MIDSSIAAAILGLLICGLSSCGREAAGSELEGCFVASVEIRFAGENRIDEDRIRSLISTKMGDIFAIERVDRDVMAIYESGMVDDVRLIPEPVGDAVRLVAEVAVRPPYGPSFCVGNTAFSDSELLAESGLDGARSITVDSLVAARKRLEDYYQGHGYPGALVRCRAFNGGDPSPEDFIFDVDEGTREQQPLAMLKKCPLKKGSRIFPGGRGTRSRTRGSWNRSGWRPGR